MLEHITSLERTCHTLLGLLGGAIRKTNLKPFSCLNHSNLTYVVFGSYLWSNNKRRRMLNSCYYYWTAVHTNVFLHTWSVVLGLCWQRGKTMAHTHKLLNRIKTVQYSCLSLTGLKALTSCLVCYLHVSHLCLKNAPIHLHWIGAPLVGLNYQKIVPRRAESSPFFLARTINLRAERASS